MSLRKHSWLLYAAGALAASGPLCAEEPALYTIEDCVRIGLERSGAAANARRDEEIASAKVIQARAAALPNLSLNGDYTRLDELQEVDVGEETFEAGTLDNYSASAEVRQLLYSGGKVAAALRAARLSRGYAEVARLDSESGLARDIRLGFHAVLLARAGTEVLEESVAQLESVLSQVEDKFRRGAASELDVLSARVRLGNERPLLIGARNAQALALADLRRALALENEAFDVDGELEHRPVRAGLEELQAVAVTNRPSIRALYAIVALREQDMAAARSGRLPELSARFTYFGANSYEFVSFGDDEWQWHWNAGLGVSWNLWDGGLTRGTVREKILEWEKSRTDLDELLKTVLLEVQRAHLDMQHARESVESGQGNIALAEKALAIAETRYDAGLATRLELTESALGVSRAKLVLLRALHDHMNAVARLHSACGWIEEVLYEGKD